MAPHPLIASKKGKLGPAERAELLTLSLMLKAEVDALLQRLPKGFVALATGTVAGVRNLSNCSAAKQRITVLSKGATLPTRDPRLSSLEFLPRLASLIVRSGCRIEPQDLIALTTPERLPLSAPGSCLELLQINAQRLQNTLREVIACHTEGATRKSHAEIQAVEGVISELLRQMRRKCTHRSGARIASPQQSLHSWGVRPKGKSRTTFRIGERGTSRGKRDLYNALREANRRELINIVGAEPRNSKYELTDAGYHAAEVASFLKKLREETVHRSVTLRLASDGRIWCSAPATRGRRARKWIDTVGSSPDREAALRLETAPPPTGRKKSKTRTQTRSPRRP